MKKILSIIFSFIFLAYFTFFYSNSFVWGTCSEAAIQQTAGDKEQINKIKDECLQLSQQSKNQKKTYENEVQQMDVQINLTLLQIQQTEDKIIQVGNEISTLTGRIEGLDNSLDYLSKQLIERVVDGYKKQMNQSMLNLMLDSVNAQNLFDRFKYVKTARDNNQKLLVQVQQAKLNFEDQKKLRESKKIQLDELTVTLNSQKQSLDGQRIQKQKFIQDAQNSAANYDRIASIAQAQIAGFKSFVVNTGAGIIGANEFGNGSDGNYYSQRDARWASNGIGYSGESVLDVGCLISSIAMVAKKYGASVTPGDIAGDVSRFWGSTAYMKLPWPGVAGKGYASVSNIDEELQNGNYVIVGIMRSSCASGGDHFVVLTKKEGDDYIMHDPIYGPDKKFHSYYSTICSSATFK